MAEQTQQERNAEAQRKTQDLIARTREVGLEAARKEQRANLATAKAGK